MEKDRISYHESVQKGYERLKRDAITNIWDRYEAQGLGGSPDNRCPFCMGGVRCDLCSNGPCRADASKDKRGVCGIKADGMAMRMMLLRNILGASTYHYHTEQTIKTLKATARGRTIFKIKEREKLLWFADRLKVSAKGSDEEVAIRLCDFVESEFNRRADEKSGIVDLLAPDERKELWKKLGIFPGGIYGEMLRASSSCLTNVDGYYLSLALKALRLSIAMAYQSQLVNEYCQDILFGIPRPHDMRVDLGVLDPDYVNVLPNGHEPFLGFAMVEVARRKEWQERAKAVGARGLRVIANIETGQEMIQRWEMDDVFFGFIGNWIMQEAVLSSGAIDLFACDMNCSMPIDPIYANRYKFKLIPVSDLVAFEGITSRIDYKPEEAEKQAERLLQMAIDNFRERRAEVEPTSGLELRNAIVGFSPESILNVLGGNFEFLLNGIKKGDLRGVVGLVSCTSLRDSGQDVHSIAVAKELLKRNVLILSLGCGNSAMQLGGLCSREATELAGEGLRSFLRAVNIPPVLSFGTCTDTGRLSDLLSSISKALGGVPVCDLPTAIVAPEYMEQKATIDAIFALAFGLYTYVNPVPTVTGAPELVKLLTVDLKDITGALLNVEKDPIKAVDGILSHIESKRKKLGI